MLVKQNVRLGYGGTHLEPQVLKIKGKRIEKKDFWATQRAHVINKKKGKEARK